MPDPTRLSHTAALILKALKEGFAYGFDIMEVTGLPSGTVYPALRRMEALELIEGSWESEQKALREDRPPRRYYKVSRAGNQALAEAEKKYPLIAQFARPKVAKA